MRKSWNVTDKWCPVDGCRRMLVYKYWFTVLNKEIRMGHRFSDESMYFQHFKQNNNRKKSNIQNKTCCLSSPWLYNLWILWLGSSILVDLQTHLQLLWITATRESIILWGENFLIILIFLKCYLDKIRKGKCTVEGKCAHTCAAVCQSRWRRGDV